MNATMNAMISAEFYNPKRLAGLLRASAQLHTRHLHRRKANNKSLWEGNN